MKRIVLVPHLHTIEGPCEAGLKQLEAAGLKIWRRRGCSGIDLARNQMVGECLHDGYDSMMFVDADVSFDPADVLRLFARPEPVISGVYAVKGVRRFASVFDGIETVIFGKKAPGSYPLVYAAGGFIRFTADVLRRMIKQKELPLCDSKWGRGFWPFFLPMVTPDNHYLGEDWAFSYRLRQLGVSVLADTSIRLYHWDGPTAYSWEEAGGSPPGKRFETYRFRCNY